MNDLLLNHNDENNTNNWPLSIILCKTEFHCSTTFTCSCRESAWTEEIDQLEVKPPRNYPNEYVTFKQWVVNLNYFFVENKSHKNLF